MKPKHKVAYIIFAPFLLAITVLYWASGENGIPKQLDKSEVKHESSKHNEDSDLSILVAGQKESDVSAKATPVDSISLNIAGKNLTVPLVYERRFTVNYDFSQPGVDLFNDLSEMAKNGDALAARELGQQLDICEESIRDKKLLGEEIESIKNSFEAGLEDEFRFEQGNYDDALNHISYIKSNFDRCESIGFDKINQKIEFYETASELGDYEATALLAAEFSENDDWENFHKVNLELWNEYGDPTALSSLFPLYSSGTITPPAEILQNHSPQVITHAMNLAFSEFYYASIELQYPDDISNILPRSDIDFSLSETSQNLSPSDHLTAEEIANELLENNPNCCRSIF